MQRIVGVAAPADAEANAALASAPVPDLGHLSRLLVNSAYETELSQISSFRVIVYRAGDMIVIPPNVVVRPLASIEHALCPDVPQTFCTTV